MGNKGQVRIIRESEGMTGRKRNAKVILTLDLGTMGKLLVCGGKQLTTLPVNVTRSFVGQLTVVL